MRTNPIFRHALIVAGLIVGTTGLFAAEAGSKTEAPKPARAGIAKGMSAEEVRKTIGEPRRIKHIESAGLEAESWIYRRKLRTETTQEIVSDTRQPAFVGLGMGDENGLGSVSVPVYRLRHTTFYQMTALLMVDGMLMEARQWTETETHYEG